MSVTNPVSHQDARVIELLTFGICVIFLISKLKLLKLLILRASDTMYKSPTIRKFPMPKLKISKQTRPITIEYDKFLETLLNNVHNALIIHQRAHKKIMNQTLNDLREKLVELQRRDLNIESNEYKEQLSLKNRLLKFDDDLTLRKCARTKLWHTINVEKPTKFFCALAKSIKGNDLLNQFKKWMHKET